MWTLVALLASVSAPTPVAPESTPRTGLSFSGHVGALPPLELVGADLEVGDPAHAWALTAEGSLTVKAMSNPSAGPRVWSVWGRWAPWSSDGHAVGILGGYSQSVNVYPHLLVGLPGETPPPVSLLDPPGFLAGVFYEWSSPDMWVRVAPHIASDFAQYSWFAPTFRSVFVGPPLLEIGWHFPSHLDVAVRLSMLPIRVGVSF